VCLYRWALFEGHPLRHRQKLETKLVQCLADARQYINEKSMVLHEGVNLRTEDMRGTHMDFTYHMRDVQKPFAEAVVLPGTLGCFDGFLLSLVQREEETGLADVVFAFTIPQTWAENIFTCIPIFDLGAAFGERQTADFFKCMERIARDLIRYR